MALRYQADRILIRCPNWIGDMVAATAALRCVRNNYARAHITLLLRPYVRPVVENALWFNEIVEYDSQKGWRGMRAAVRALRREPRYDLALLLTHSTSSALVAWLAGARRRVGHGRHGRSLLLTDAVPWPAAGPERDLVSKVTLYSSLLEYLGLEGVRNARPQLFTSPEDEAAVTRLLAGRGADPARGLLAIVPGAAYGASKLWPTERFAAAADELARRDGLQPMILTGPGESRIAKEIAREMLSSPITFDEQEMTFGRLKALIRRSRLLLCNDTGPRHVAIAYNVPTVVLMGPTSPRVTDSNYDRTIILRQEVPCGPCYLRTCPTDHRCMELITVPMVVDAAEELLKRCSASD